MHKLLESSQWELVPVKCCGSEIPIHNKSLDGKKINKRKNKCYFMRRDYGLVHVYLRVPSPRSQV